MSLYKLERWFLLFASLSLFFACGDAEQELISPKGGYQQIDLKSGTSIKLGPQSKAIYKLSSDQVKLEGEGIIKVPSGKTVTILTPNGKFVGEAGEFRIHSRRTTMNVFVLNGKGTASNIDGEAAKELTSETFAIYNGKNLAHSDKKSLEQMTNDKYWVFNSASVRFILESLAAQYSITFEWSDANLNKVFSGFVPRDDIQIALSIVLRSVGLEYEENGSTYVLKNAAYNQ